MSWKDAIAEIEIARPEHEQRQVETIVDIWSAQIARQFAVWGGAAAIITKPQLDAMITEGIREQEKRKSHEP